MAANVGDAPSRAWALGELAALLARTPTHPETDPKERARREAIEVTAARVRAIVDARRGRELARNVAARELAALNGRRAEHLPRHAKLVLQAEGLRKAQQAATDLVKQRQLRRQRAEVGVRVDDLARVLARLEREAQTARDHVATAERDLAEGEHAGHLARSELKQLQRESRPLAAYLAPIEHSLLLGSCHFFLGETHARRDAFVDSRRRACDALVVLCRQMVQGQFREAEVEAFANGRARMVGELTWGLLAVGGEEERLATLFLAMQPSQFAHQIWSVFRAYLPVLFARRDEVRLFEAARPHRWVQGLRGALAEATWRLLTDDAQAFAEALKTIPLHDWRQGYGRGYEAFGLVSVMAAGLARLGHERGWKVPQTTLTLTAPAELWTS